MEARFERIRMRFDVKIKSPLRLTTHRFCTSYIYQKVSTVFRINVNNN